MSYRLLAGLPAPTAISLGEHIELHGDVPLPSRADRRAYIAEVERAGLRGRGGAGFPTSVKLAAVAERRRPMVVVNGVESEPMSSKDRVLLELVPHLVLDGAIVAARISGSRDCVIAAPAVTHPGLRRAIAERRELRKGHLQLKLAATAPGYVAGEETALLSHLEGRGPLPRLTPPRPAERGLRGRPTLVQNVETLAQLALIARHGADWFRSEGSGSRPGTTLVTISGAVQRPGVYEVPTGIPLPLLLSHAGGQSEPTRALLVGGYFGAWVDGTGEGLTLDDDSLRTAGAAGGAGIVVALGQSSCPVAETARLAAWLAVQSARQCGPCVHGLQALADLLIRVASGRAVTGDRQRLDRWTAMIRGRGACAHPDGATRMIASAARVFDRELADHARQGPCSSCQGIPILSTPSTRTAMAA